MTVRNSLEESASICRIGIAGDDVRSGEDLGSGLSRDSPRLVVDNKDSGTENVGHVGLEQSSLDEVGSVRLLDVLD